MSFSNLLLSVAVVDSLPNISSPPLLPRHEATPLLQFYFDNIYTQLPFFVERSFWTSIDSIYEPGGRFAKPFDHFLVRMVLAIASATMSYQSDDKSQQRSLALVVGALEYAEDVLQPGSIVGIQAILLLAQYSLANPMHFRSWYLVGMAVRLIVDLGLHQDPPEEVILNRDRLDLCRRVFHCTYCLDRYVLVFLLLSSCIFPIGQDFLTSSLFSEGNFKEGLAQPWEEPFRSQMPLLTSPSRLPQPH